MRTTQETVFDQFPIHIYESQFLTRQAGLQHVVTSYLNTASVSGTDLFNENLFGETEHAIKKPEHTTKPFQTH